MIEIEQVENVRSSLADDPTLTVSQEKNLATIIGLIQETQQQRNDQSDASRSRRKAARACLSAILKRLGRVTLFLCIAALSLSKLYKLNSKADDFISQLRARFSDITIAKGITSLAEKHLTTDLLQRLGSPEASTSRLKRGALAHHGTTKRPRTEPSTAEHAAVPSYHGVLELEKYQALNKTPTDVDDGLSHGDTDDESDSGEVEDADTQPDNSHFTPKDNDLDFVYHLRNMDVIRAVVDQRANFTARLTVPPFEEAMPFITLHCPRILASEFMTKRNKIRW